MLLVSQIKQKIIPSAALNNLQTISVFINTNQYYINIIKKCQHRQHTRVKKFMTSTALVLYLKLR